MGELSDVLVSPSYRRIGVHEERHPMEAYEFRQDFATMTEAAEIDRVEMEFPPLRHWQLETGGGTKVPEEWLKAWPTRAIVKPSETSLTPWLAAGSYCVNEKVKRVIESLAPGVHQFIPLALEAGPSNNRRTYQYYSLHIADRADDVVIEKSDLEWTTSKYSGKNHWRKWSNKPIVLPFSSICGKHIWHNRPCLMSLMSGELHDSLLKLGLAGGLEFQKQIVD
jgi:hypothetical protein